MDPEEYNSELSIDALNSMLLDKIKNLDAITPPSEVARHNILSQIADLPFFTRRLSGFLDYAIDQTSYLQHEIWNAQTELNATLEKLPPSKQKNDPYVDEKIKNIAQKLGCKINDVEPEINKLLQANGPNPDEEDYIRASRLLSADDDQLSFAIAQLIETNKGLSRIHDSNHKFRLGNSPPQSPSQLDFSDF